jgi:hypothetical protein
MSKIPEIERRLRNWAQWKLGGHGGRSGGCAPMWREAVSGGGYDGVPVLSVEASDTDSAIAQLDQSAQRTLHEVYLSDDSKAVLESRLGVGIDAIRRRINQAHRDLQRIFEDRAAALKAARARFESLSRLHK